jgi:hypothetical protein
MSVAKNLRNAILKSNQSVVKNILLIKPECTLNFFLNFEAALKYGQQEFLQNCYNCKGVKKCM